MEMHLIYFNGKHSNGGKKEINADFRVDKDNWSL